MTDQELYDNNIDKVYGFFMAKTFNKHLSEDLTSTVFMNAYEQFANSEKSQFIEDKQKYLYGIAKITWTQYLRNKYKSEEVDVDDFDDFEKYIIRVVDDTKSMSLIHRALPYIDQLPTKQKEILLLRFRDGLSIKEICTHQNSSMNYVKTTQKRGIASLKKIIQGEQL